jgi:protein gp37
MSKRLRGRAGYPIDDPFRITLHPSRLEQPLRWSKPRRVFVCSMGDLFHDDVPNEFICDIFRQIWTCWKHTFIILTKRPKRMKEFIHRWRWKKFPCCEGVKGIRKLPKNLWLGVTVENEDMLKKRMPYLAQIKDINPNVITFLSNEPALGPIDIYPDGEYDEKNGKFYKIPYFAFIDWVICGCESGPGARSMDSDWARSLRDQCVNMGIPFFLKQRKINGKLVKMPELNGQVWDQMPK